jgi:hypothetical protein
VGATLSRKTSPFYRVLETKSKLERIGKVCTTEMSVNGIWISQNNLAGDAEQSAQKLPPQPKPHGVLNKYKYAVDNQWKVRPRVSLGS